MLITLVFFTILSIAASELAEQLNNLRQEDGWNAEVVFWGKIACRAGKRRVFSLHEIPKTDSSRRLHDFFGDLVTNVQTKCGTTIETKSYQNVEYTYNGTRLSWFSGLDYEENLEKSSVVIEKPDNVSTTASNSEIHIFPQRDVEILVMLMEDSVRVLTNGTVFKNWDNRRHVVVFMITKKQLTSNSSKLMTDTFVILLQRLWHENRVLNVFFVAPFSSLGHLVWFYDPFVKNATSGVRGQIFARKVLSIPSVKRLTNLHGYRLNIGMFEAPPAAIKYCPKTSYDVPFAQKSQRFVGVDGLTMETVANHMNFTLNIVPPTDGIEFGYVNSNGTFFGTIGDAAHHRIDIGFNSMYTKIYVQHEHCTNTIDFTIPIDFDRLCIIVPRARKIPRWLRTFHYFHPAIWLCLVITHIIVALVWYIIRNIPFSTRNKFMNHPSSSYPSLLKTTFFLFIGTPVNLKVSQIERIILVALLIFGVTVMGTFTGTLYHSFTHEMYYKEIGTLKELDQSGITIGTASPNLKDVFGLNEMVDDPEEIKSLQKKFKVIDRNGLSTIEKTAYRRNVASLSRENSFTVSKHRYVDDTGNSLIHLVPDCPRSYYLSYVMSKDSIYLKRVNTLIRRLLQAGLPPLWNSLTTDKLIHVDSVTDNLRRSNTEKVPFNLRDMQTAFLLLLIGHAIAICILIGEISCNKRRGVCKILVGFRGNSVWRVCQKIKVCRSK